MSVATRGTQMYVLNDSVVSEAECITSFSSDNSPANRIEDICLSETNTRSYKKGLHTPGQTTVAPNVGLASDNHIMPSNLAESSDQTNLTFAIGWVDETDEPTVATPGNPDTIDGLSLPDTRTWYVFQGYVSDFPFDFQANMAVQTSATIRRSGQGVWAPKTQPTS